MLGGKNLSGKSKGGNTISAVWNIVEPIAKELNLEIWDIRFLKEGATWYLRVFIDKEGGVDIEDCVNLSHAIDKPLDDADPIEQSYCLEVSSPGVERELTRDEHFSAVLDDEIKLKLIRPIDNSREFSGILNSYKDGEITLTLENGEKFTINKKDTAWVKLDDFDD